MQGLQAKYDLVTANPPYILPGDRPDFLPLSFVQRWSCPVARKLPAHSQRRYCYYELRGGPREFAQTASRSLSEEGKFCIVHAPPLHASSWCMYTCVSSETWSQEGER